MEIPFRILNRELQTSNNARGYFYNNTNIDNKDISVLMLCILFHNGKITRKGFTTRMNEFHKDNGASLKRPIGIYHSKILVEWFHKTTMTDILLLEVLGSCSDRDLSFERYLELLNIGLNRNYNYCLGFIAVGIYLPILKHYNEDFKTEFLDDSGLGFEAEFDSFGKADREHDLGSGYCCSDCDGCYTEYKRSRYRAYYKETHDGKTKENLRDVFLSLKKHDRNPNCEIKSQYC